MKNIILTFVLFVAVNFSFAQVESPYYSLASKQVEELVKYLNNIDQPVDDAQQATILNVCIGILDKINSVETSDMTQEEKTSSILKIKEARDKYIMKSFNEIQKEKYKGFVYSGNSVYF